MIERVFDEGVKGERVFDGWGAGVPPPPTHTQLPLSARNKRGPTFRRCGPRLGGRDWFFGVRFGSDCFIRWWASWCVLGRLL